MPSRGAFGAAKAEKSKARDRRLIAPSHLAKLTLEEFLAYDSD